MMQCVVMPHRGSHQQQRLAQADSVHLHPDMAHAEGADPRRGAGWHTWLHCLEWGADGADGLGRAGQVGSCGDGGKVHKWNPIVSGSARAAEALAARRCLQQGPPSASGGPGRAIAPGLGLAAPVLDAALRQVSRAGQELVQRVAPWDHGVVRFSGCRLGPCRRGIDRIGMNHVRSRVKACWRRRPQRMRGRLEPDSRSWSAGPAAAPCCADGAGVVGALAHVGGRAASRRICSACSVGSPCTRSEAVGPVRQRQHDRKRGIDTNLVVMGFSDIAVSRRGMTHGPGPGARGGRSSLARGRPAHCPLAHRRSAGGLTS